MGAWRNLPGLVLGLLLLNAMFANSTFADDVSSQAYPLRIKVLSAETHALNEGTQVPKDCGLTDFSAYCNESRNPTAQSIMLVQDAKGKSYRIICTTDSRWSKCEPLPVGETFEARQEKHGFTILYRSAKGKERKQFYRLIAEVSAPQSGAAANPQPPAAATPQSSPAPAPHAAAPPQNSPAPAPVPPPVSAQGVLKEKVKCNFSSTPSGADITIDDWKYVGSTPSEISLSTGTHVVVISMPGFVEWKRELTVAPDSVVNVTATLQKTQP
jgi:hypothetical protein